MFAVAIGFWVIQVLCSITGVGEIASEIIAFIQIPTFLIWFWFLGIHYSGKDAFLKVGTTLGLDVVEILPFINDIPVMIIQIAVIIMISRKEDEAKAMEEAKAAEKAAAEQAQAAQKYYAIRAQQAARAANDNGVTA